MRDRANEIEDVYRRRHTAFRSALATVVGSAEAADDVVQESFARALAHQTQYRGDGPLEAWIWRIAIRTALERRQARLDLPIEEVLDPQLPEPERDSALAAAVRNLPPRRRLLVFLRYIADFSYADIAEICGVSEGTVAATLAQARTALAEELGYVRSNARASKGAAES